MLRSTEKSIRRAKNQALKSLFRTRFLQKLAFRGVVEDLPFITLDLDDHRLMVDPKETIGRTVYLQKNWRRKATDHLLRILRDEAIVTNWRGCLELGANIGTQTIYIERTRLFSRIVAVEPDPRNMFLLQNNIALNDMGGSVVLQQCAVGEADQVVPFFINAGNQGKNSLVNRTDTDGSISVTMKTPASILRDARIGPEDIGFVWMDIEGFEFPAMREIVQMLGANVPVFMEFSPVFYGLSQTADFVEFLARHYAHSYVFKDDVPAYEARAPRDIPQDIRQCDLLLFNRA